MTEGLGFFTAFRMTEGAVLLASLKWFDRLTMSGFGCAGMTGVFLQAKSPFASGGGGSMM